MQDLEERVHRLVAESPDIPAVIAAAAKRLLKTRSTSSMHPHEIVRGYWPTISLQWTSKDREAEVEVTETDYEYYGSDVPYGIRYFPHDDASVVPDGLLELLPT